MGPFPEHSCLYSSCTFQTSEQQPQHRQPRTFERVTERIAGAATLDWVAGRTAFLATGALLLMMRAIVAAGDEHKNGMEEMGRARWHKQEGWLDM